MPFLQTELKKLAALQPEKLPTPSFEPFRRNVFAAKQVNSETTPKLNTEIKTSTLPEHFDLQALTEEDVKNFLFLFEKGHGRDILERLPSHIDLSLLSEPAIQLLNGLLTNVILHVYEVTEQFRIQEDLLSRCTVTRINLKTHSSILKKLIENKKLTEQLFLALPDQINLKDLTPHANLFLSQLIRRVPTYGESIFSKLLTTFELGVSKEADEFLSQLISFGLSKQILDNLPTPIPDSVFNRYSSASIIWELANLGYRDKLVRKISYPITLHTLNAEKSVFLSMFVSSGFGEFLAQRTDWNIELSEIDTGAIEYLVSLIHAGFGEKLGHLIKKDPRKPLSIEATSEIENIPNNLLDKSIAAMVKKSSLTKKIGEWEVYSFKKNEVDINDEDSSSLSEDDVGSKTDIYLNPKTKKIIFRTKKIPTGAIKVYAKVRQAIPEYIPGSYYPELNTRKEYTALRSDGFREVYAGITLFELAPYLDLFPQAIREAISEQKNYLLLKLASMGIQHGILHSHRRNFNVRFLLTSEKGHKTLIFNPKEALLRATSQPKVTITPIVNLRDWDQGRMIAQPSRQERTMNL